ncbi:MAG: hypothetical protein M1814_005056 [Vezdaea aestivalis]|nr:MAG: hypothetical protein M1814_005056 [Vezdaea aestivalis]
MQTAKLITRYNCPRYPRTLRQCLSIRSPGARHSSAAPARSWESNQDGGAPKDNQQKQPGEVAKGQMSQTLETLTSQAIADAGPRAAQAVEESGFSAELKAKLEERIVQATFKSDNAQALSQTGIPRGAGRGVHDDTASQPWTGHEGTEDAVLRMLMDAHKPLKGAKKPNSRPKIGQPVNPDVARRTTKQSSGQRLANARDQSSTYSLARDGELTDKERERMKQDLKERFEPGARPMPNTVRGLQSLANEKIEDAIGRGLFKNLPRGKEIERDHNASSPFIDTTEYLLNRLIQRQDIVPPWIEKQQQISRDVSTFRSRLRNDWRRHAARLISSGGGTLAEKMKKAEDYARAEVAFNPKPKSKEGPEKETIEALATSDARVLEKLVETALNDKNTDVELGQDITKSQPPPELEAQRPLPPLFRDEAWEKAEHPYHRLSVEALNNLTRSYNLMAPDLAKKPYFSLQRELSAAFRDAAPLIANEIYARATSKPLESNIDEILGSRGAFAERFNTQKARVHDEKKPQYGFKQFFRDLWDPEAKP